MSDVPAGTELTRPFLPANDFELSGVLWHVAQRRPDISHD